MMNDMGDWRFKADEDLTAEDFEHMRLQAEPAEIRLTPHVPGEGVFVGASPNSGASHVIRAAPAAVGLTIVSPAQPALI